MLNHKHFFIINLERDEIMNIDYFYENAFGRMLLNTGDKAGMYKLGALYLNSKLSKGMIPKFIAENQIDMSEFEGQTYNSFAEFFSRTKSGFPYEAESDVLISPSDSLLTMYSITKDMNIPMKGSWYRLNDIIPDETIAQEFNDGLCLVFRLQATDYHHFCCFDDANLIKTHYIPGMLHSVQPIAYENVPVFRLNRRWWSILETQHFGKAIQIEVGAMMVGGVAFEKEEGNLTKGMDMGHFTLAGSTIILLLDSKVKENLTFYYPVTEAVDGNEVPVSIGQGIGKLNK